MVDLSPFQEQADEALRRFNEQKICADPRSAFHDTIAAAGLEAKSITVGRMERVKSTGDKGVKKSGWYIYYEIASSKSIGFVIGFGAYGCWRNDIKEKWSSVSEHKMTTEERLSYFSAREEINAEIERETKARQTEAAQEAFQLWQEAKDATADNAYLKKKSVNPTPGVKQLDNGRLLVPVCDGAQIISTQSIQPDSTKRFLSGGRTKGGYFIIEGSAAKIYIAEGYATAASLYEATGHKCYVAFSCHNLYETASRAIDENPGASVVICGDNGNGSKNANQAAESLGLQSIFPPDPNISDFNDYHQAHGIEALASFLGKTKIEAYEKKEDSKDFSFAPFQGFIQDCYNYYRATDGNNQPGFALQTAMALTAVLCGRSYKSDYENYTNLYFLNVGKSATGKEHPKTVIERILRAANMSHLVGGDGYTSAGAVFTMLMNRPVHITCIDEFGRYLEAGRDLKNGNSNQREGNTKLMEAFGRSHDVMRPQTYSAMTVKKEVAEQSLNRQVYNPSITIMSMTTPDTFYKAMTMDAIKDGFINRFVICQSNAKRQVRKHKPPLDVPIKILDWIERIQARHGGGHTHNEPPKVITLNFSSEAVAAQEKFQQYCIEQANNLERFGMAELTGRSNEIAMRVALAAALSESPEATTIEERHMRWAIEYSRYFLCQTIETLKHKIAGSDHEGHKKEILAALRESGAEGVIWSQMMKTAPYSKFKKKDLEEILTALIDADLAAEESYKPSGGGRPSRKFIALK